MNPGAEDPMIPKMDLDVAGRLALALMRARRMPTSFGVKATSDEGIGVMRVLVVDDVVYQQRILPLLIGQGISINPLPL